ncbi:hypothetical protein [Virgibacillus doumboii]|uniref:hypothetical protein n=1 Tax=Virgibacillus doumboii TaxID=2697503 RepID=UPI0013E01E95|nr:hypothetical protein [Virgibacillus doumboii]
MLKKLYYTRDITLAALLGSAVTLLVFIAEGLMRNSSDLNALVTQSIIVVVLYFIIFFIAYFLLINPFYDSLIRNVSVMLTAIIILAIANVILVAGLYVDTSRTFIEVVMDNLGLFLAVNISIIFFSWKKQIRKGASKQ